MNKQELLQIRRDSKGKIIKIDKTLSHYSISRPSFQTRILFRISIKGAQDGKFIYQYRPEESVTVDDYDALDRWEENKRKEFESQGAMARKWVK